MNEHTGVVKRPATYQDVLDAPPNMIAEIINGALHLHARPHPRHSRVSAVLIQRIGGPFDYDEDGPGGWIILPEPELHLDAHVLVPDIAGWRRDRLLNALPDEPHISLTPDWTCEVLSPATRTYDLTEKREIYRRSGVGYLWFVDPRARTLEAFVLDNNRWTLIAALHDEAEARIPPFEAFAFSLAALWWPLSAR